MTHTLGPYKLLTRFWQVTLFDPMAMKKLGTQPATIKKKMIDTTANVKRSLHTKQR